MIVFLEKDERLPDPLLPRRNDTLAFSQDLTAERMIEAYPQGIFPYFAYKDKFVRWCAPRERYVIFPDEIHISHSMRNIMNRNIYRVTINENFEEVIWACAKVDGRIFEDGAWLGPELIKIWIELHRRGYAKSVEVWNEDNELVGGLYGFVCGRAFIGDSMFSLVPSASKLAMIHLARHMQSQGGGIIDCQLETSHLKSMGARYISYEEYLKSTQSPDEITWPEADMPTNTTHNHLSINTLHILRAVP